MTRSTTMMLLDDAAVGCVTSVVVAAGTSVFYFVDGTLRSSARGCRLAGGVQAVVTNAPRVRRWASWSGVLLTIQACMVETCQVRGPLTMAVAGGASNALFSMHRGTGAAVRSGLKGAAIGGVAWIAINSIVRFIDSLESSD